MKNYKKNVRIHIESTANGSSKTVQKTTGIIYEKNDSIYLRYDEPDESMGKTTTVLKIRSEEANSTELSRQSENEAARDEEKLRVIDSKRRDERRVQELSLNRFGDTKMNQRFIPGKEQTIIYSMQQGSLEWKVFTHQARAELSHGQGMIEWEYDSWFAQQYTGKMRILITVCPVDEVEEMPYE